MRTTRKIGRKDFRHNESPCLTSRYLLTGLWYILFVLALSLPPNCRAYITSRLNYRSLLSRTTNGNSRCNGIISVGDRRPWRQPPVLSTSSSCRANLAFYFDSHHYAIDDTEVCSSLQLPSSSYVTPPRRQRRLKRFKSSAFVSLTLPEQRLLFHRAQLRPLNTLFSSPRDDNPDYHDEVDDDHDISTPIPINNNNHDDFLTTLNRFDVESLTVPQLKQQLRLRGLKVSGRKSELVERLLGGGSGGASTDVRVGKNNLPDATADVENDEILDREVSGQDQKEKSKARIFAEQRGKELIDVTAYLDGDEKGKYARTLKTGNDEEEKKKDDEEENEPETWGSSAKIVDDYEGRSLVVDGLSRLVVEYTGSNQTKVNAYVVASRDALKAYLAGGQKSMNITDTPEQRLREIQVKREKSVKLPEKFEEDEGLEDKDDPGEAYENIIERDFGDWGKYTQTGAQLSASEVQGVLLLSDVYGPFTEDTKYLADKIAFECQPIVVMVPDLFRGRPWKEVQDGVNEWGETYEEWRASHPELRVSVDMRAAAAVLRERYGVSSVAVWGTCYGGGRALEAASGYLPNGIIHDVDGTVGPPLVEPMAAVAWYPTRYDARSLFGPDQKGSTISLKTGKERREDVAVMAIFAEEDTLPGATPVDASVLKSLLESDGRVKDHMVKVFPGQTHGFGHIGLAKSRNEASDDESNRFVDEEFGGAGRVSLDGGDAEVACLLSTAWMETYSRVFLPTIGPAIKDDEDQSWAKLQMKDLEDVSQQRNVREELNDALSKHEDMKLQGANHDQYEGVTREVAEEVDKFFDRLGEALDKNSNYINVDDNFFTMYEKLKEADEDGALPEIPEALRLSLDDTEEAFW